MKGSEHASEEHAKPVFRLAYRAQFPWAIPLIAVVVSGLLHFAHEMWFGWDGGRLFVARAITVAITLLVIYAWFAALPFWKPRARRWLVAVPLIAILAAAAAFRVRGLSGNLVPVLTLRWRPDSDVVPSTAGVAADVDLSATTADDYPQFLGPDRNAVLPDVRLATDWDNHPPKLRWRQPIGLGWSSFAVVGPFAVTQEQHGEEESVVCYRVETGELCWRHSDVTRFRSVVAGDGPRATPTIVDGHVYTVGATGLLNCLDGATGELIWQRDFIADADSTVHKWGVSCSPLVVDGKVIVSPGGPLGRSLAAYDAISGELLWHGGDDLTAYSSPTLATLLGEEQILIVNSTTVAAHRPSDGRLLWDFPWPNSGENVSQAVPIGDDRVFLSAGYGSGCSLLELSRDADDRIIAKTLWKNSNLKTKFSNVVVRDDVVFGIDDPGVLTCLEVSSGKRQWKRGRYGHGQVLLAGDTLVVLAEYGELILVRARADRLVELARIQALEGKTWNNPVIAGRFLLLRNDRQAACFELPAPTAALPESVALP